MPKSRSVGTTPFPTKPKGGKGRAAGGGAGVGDDYGTKPPDTNPLPDPIDDDPVVVPTPAPRAPRPKPRFQDQVFKRQTDPLRAFWGKKRLRGAQIVYDKILDNGSELVVYRWCWGPIQSLTDFKVEGRSFDTLGSGFPGPSPTQYHVYLNGSPAADSLMAAHEPSWATIDHPTDCAHLIVHYHKGTSQFPGVTNPEEIECIGEGLLSRDPAQDPTLVTRYYHEDLALAIADFMTDGRFGMDVDDDEIDWDWIAQASLDVSEDLGSGRLRFGPIGLELNSTMDPEEALEFFRGHGAMDYTYSNGKWLWWVNKARASSGIAFTDEGATANIVANPQPALSVKGSSEIPSQVTVRFTHEAADWKEDVASYPAVVPAGDDGPIWTFNYNGVRKYDHAYRLAKQIYKMARNDKTATMRVFADGLRVLPGSRVTVEHSTHLNWEDVETTILQSKPVAGRSSWDLTHGLYNEADFDDSEFTTTPYAPPANPSPYVAPDPPLSPASNATLTLGDGFEQDLTQSPAIGVDVSWEAPEWPWPLEYKVTKQRAGGTEVVVVPNAQEGDVVFVSLDLLASWTIRVYAIVATSGIISATALAGTCDPINDFTFPTPEWPTQVSLGLNPTTRRAILGFSEAKNRSRDLYGAASWSHVGMTGVTLGLINDGSNAAVAATVTEDDTLTVDLGSAQALNELRAQYTSLAVTSGGPSFTVETVSYSDDGTNFTDQSLSVNPGSGGTGNTVFRNHIDFGDSSDEFITCWEGYSLGSHRWWKFQFSVAAASADLRELQLYAYVGSPVTLTGYKIYNITRSTASPLLFTTVPFGHGLTSIDVTDIVQQSGTHEHVAVRIVGVDILGVESEPIDAMAGWAYSSPAATVSAPATTSGVETFANKALDSSNTVVTQATADSSTKPASTAFVHAVVAADGVEVAQDAIGAMAIDTATIDVTYTDGTPEIKWDVKDDSITFAKMANIATDRLIGRDTAGTGDPEALTVGGGIEFTGTGIQTSALTGDVTKAAGGTATTIANDAVTFAKMQNIATDRLIGRDTAATGDPEEISVGGGLEFSGAAAIQRSALTGDVSASAGSDTTTIGNNAVTYAKMQDVAATQRLIGRNTAGAGDPEEVTLDQLLAWANMTHSSGKIGIGGTDTSVHFYVTAGAAASYMKVQATNSSNAFLFMQNSTRYWNVGVEATTGSYVVQNQGVTATMIDVNNNVGFFGNGSFGGGTNVISILNRSAAPGSNPTGGYIVYAESGALKGRGSSGTTTTIGAAEPHCPQCKRDVGVVEAVNHEGGYVFICLPCLIEDLNLTGKPYVVTDDHPTAKPAKRQGKDLEDAIAAAKVKAAEVREAAKHVPVVEPEPGELPAQSGAKKPVVN